MEDSPAAAVEDSPVAVCCNRMVGQLEKRTPAVEEVAVSLGQQGTTPEEGSLGTLDSVQGSLGSGLEGGTLDSLQGSLGSQEGSLDPGADSQRLA